MIFFIVIILIITLVIFYIDRRGKALIKELEKQLEVLSEEFLPLLTSTHADLTPILILSSKKVTATLPEYLIKTVILAVSWINGVYTPSMFSLGVTADEVYILARSGTEGEIFEYQFGSSLWTQWAQSEHSFYISRNKYPSGLFSEDINFPLMAYVGPNAFNKDPNFTDLSVYFRNSLTSDGTTPFDETDDEQFGFGSDAFLYADADLRLVVCHELMYVIDRGVRIAPRETMSICWAQPFTGAGLRQWHMIDLGIKPYDFDIRHRTVSEIRLFMVEGTSLYDTQLPGSIPSLGYINTEIGLTNHSQYDLDVISFWSSSVKYTLVCEGDLVIELVRFAPGADLFFILNSFDSIVYYGKLSNADTDKIITLKPITTINETKTPIWIDVSSDGKLGVLHADNTLELISVIVPLLA